MTTGKPGMYEDGSRDAREEVRVERSHSNSSIGEYR